MKYRASGANAMFVFVQSVEKSLECPITEDSGWDENIIPVTDN